MTELDKAVQDLGRAANADVVCVTLDGDIAAKVGEPPVGFSLDATIEVVAERFSELHESEPAIYEQFDPDRGLHVARVGRRGLLFVVFGPSSSPGLVRLRVKQALGTFHRILDADDEPEQPVGVAVGPRA